MMKRSIVSQIISFLFLVLSVTGILMYIKPFDKGTTILHITIGLIFILGIILHLINNYRALLGYFKKGKPQNRFFSWTAVGWSFSLLLMILLSAFGLPPMKQIYEFGERLKAEKDIYYQFLETNSTLDGKEISVEVKMGTPSHTPTLAVWIEDNNGNYLQDLYVSQKLAKQQFINYEHKRRPEALPVWSHRKGEKAADGLYVPDESNPIPDGMTGATPSTNWLLASKLKDEKLDSIIVFLEINQSFDWNEFYHEAAFPDDEVYSGPGKVGQPALVYASAVIDLNTSSIHKMKLLGHSHYSGKNGNIQADLQHLTTALDMIERILVDVK